MAINLEVVVLGVLLLLTAPIWVPLVLSVLSALFAIIANPIGFIGVVIIVVVAVIGSHAGGIKLV